MQPEAAHVADRPAAGGRRPQAVEQLRAAGLGVGRQALVADDVERGVGRRTGDDVAAVRAAVRAGCPAVDAARAGR